jgi:hypothetical protein
MKDFDVVNKELSPQLDLGRSLSNSSTISSKTLYYTTICSFVEGQFKKDGDYV